MSLYVQTVPVQKIVRHFCTFNQSCKIKETRFKFLTFSNNICIKDEESEKDTYATTHQTKKSCKIYKAKRIKSCIWQQIRVATSNNAFNIDI